MPALVKLSDFCDILYFSFFKKNHKIRSLYLCGKGTESHLFRKFTKFWKFKSGTNCSAVLKTLPWVGPFNRSKTRYVSIFGNITGVPARTG